MNDEIQFYVSLELIKSFLVDKLVSAVQIKVYTKYIHNTYSPHFGIIKQKSIK